MKLLNLAKLVPELSKRILMPQISRVNLALTQRCNHRCVSCDIWKNNGNAPSDIIFDEVERLIRQNDFMWLSLTGGEPTLNKDFEGILTECLIHLPMTNVITNGEDAKNIPGQVARALENSQKGGLLILHISLFGSPEVHNRMTGIENAYDRQITTMKALKFIKSDRLILGFEHMLSFRNPGEYEHVRMMAQKLGVGLTYVVEQNAGYYMNENKQIPKLEIPKLGFQLSPTDWFKNIFLLKYKQVGSIKCVAGQYSCFVLPNKQVYSCFFRVPGHPVFNLQDTNFKIKNEYFKKDSDFIKYCAGCLTPCESYTAIAFRPWRIF